ncbi:hypothetical protein GS399_05170 [Pedobacter sp. HMF7647]|uniref:Uncharacterized protein n=1 Tax=Hufsiella arboris TaxID=2695275 RepID=A0A7K1Y715_9SPHI|nr:DUF6520 family protein [Hufsiella arboris]MXV50355.1 hypothetical protein [Hufsiella arboris]
MKKPSFSALAALILGLSAAFAFKPAEKRAGTVYIRDENYNWQAFSNQQCEAADDACKVRFPSNYTPVNGPSNYASTMSHATEIVTNNGQLQ